MFILKCLCTESLFYQGQVIHTGQSMNSAVQDNIMDLLYPPLNNQEVRIVESEFHKHYHVPVNLCLEAFNISTKMNQ